MRVTFEHSRHPLLEPPTNEGEIHLTDVVSLRRIVQPTSELWEIRYGSVERARAEAERLGATHAGRSVQLQCEYGGLVCIRGAYYNVTSIRKR